MTDPRGQALIAAMTYAHEHGINPAPSFDMVGRLLIERGSWLLMLRHPGYAVDISWGIALVAIAAACNAQWDKWDQDERED